MPNHYIEIKKQRELGEILTDTFGFLRIQFKPFFTTFLKIVGPYLAVMLLSQAGYTYFLGGQVNFTDTETSITTISLFMQLILSLIYLLSIVVVFTMSQATVLYYIKSYSNSNGQPDFEEIKTNVYRSFWSFIGLGIIVGLSIGLGMLFCLIPGIYLYVPLSLTFSILVFTQHDVMDSYSYSFKLIKGEWWITFATLIVIVIIITIASYAFAMPAVLYNLIKEGTTAGTFDIENFSSLSSDPVYILLNIIASLAQFLLNIISIIAGCLIYFNLNEKKNFTGTYERIKNLGDTIDQ